MSSDADGTSPAPWYTARWTPLALAGAALLPRALWALYCQPEPASDYKHFAYSARRLVDLGQFDPMINAFPGYPTYLALWLQLGDHDGILIAGTVLLASLGVIPLWLLARRLFADPRVALLAGCAYALYPGFLLYSPVLASEHLYAPLLFAALWAATLRIPIAPRMALAALLTGLAALTRGEAVFQTPAVMLALYLFYEQPVRWRRVGAALVVGLCAGLVVLPWVVRNERVKGPGAGLSTLGGPTFYFARTHSLELNYYYTNLNGTPLEGLPAVEANREGYRLGLERIKERPGEAILRIPLHTLRLYWPSSHQVYWCSRVDEERDGGFVSSGLPGEVFFRFLCHVGWAFLLIAGPAAWLWRREVETRVWLLLAGPIFLNWLCYGVVFFGMARFRYVPETVLCALSGFTLARLWARREAAS